MTNKLISFSIQKDVVILNYLQDEGKEIIAMIPPFLFCTYLVDLCVINNRGKLGNTTIFQFASSGLWYEFEIMAISNKFNSILTPTLLEAIIELHEDTELLKSMFDVKGNTNFSLN